jgi:uncharacterized protein
MDTQATPIEAKERIYTLDVIRGFALLGIFIMNMPSFNTSFFINFSGSQLFPATYDVWAENLRDVFFSGKFNSMFSMLFAIGFILQLERLEARDPEHAKAIYLRRIFWLFVFGAIHQCVFWTGDVLHIYALLGIVLLALRRAPEKLLWTLFGVCMVYPVGMGLWRLLVFTPEYGEHIRAVSKAWATSNDLAYGQGTWLAAAIEHSRETLALYTEPFMLRGMLTFYVQVFGTMLLGLMLGRREFFQNSAQHLPFVRRMQWSMLAIGLATGAVYGVWQATTTDFVTPTPFRLIAGICYFLCRVAIMIFYVATIVRCVHNESLRRRLAPMAIAGRMPLTNYLSQTLMATFIFYGWGLGFWNRVGPALDLVIAFAIFFVVQVPLSKWWLGRFELGPMEYLWRRLTYGHATLKRSPPARAAAH